MPTSSLLSTAAQDHLKKQQLMSFELGRTIQKLNGVNEARVHLNLADKSLLSANRSAVNQVAILVTADSIQTANSAQIKKLTLAAIPDLDPSNVEVFVSTPKKTPLKTTFVGPIEVVSSSAHLAKICLGSLLLLCLILAVVLVFVGFRLRRLRLEKR